MNKMPSFVILCIAYKQMREMSSKNTITKTSKKSENTIATGDTLRKLVCLVSFFFRKQETIYVN